MKNIFMSYEATLYILSSSMFESCISLLCFLAGCIGCERSLTENAAAES